MNLQLRGVAPAGDAAGCGVCLLGLRAKGGGRGLQRVAGLEAEALSFGSSREPAEP